MNGWFGITNLNVVTIFLKDEKDCGGEEGRDPAAFRKTVRRLRRCLKENTESCSQRNMRHLRPGNDLAKVRRARRVGISDSVAGRMVVMLSIKESRQTIQGDEMQQKHNPG
jgi:hypothetical protein